MQAAGSARPKRSNGRLVLLGSALAVFAIAGVVLGYAVLPFEFEKDARESLEATDSRSQGGSLGVVEPEIPGVERFVMTRDAIPL